MQRHGRPRELHYGKRVMNSAAIVTLVIGDAHREAWLKYSAANWQAYAQKHQLDLIAIDEPLDHSPRALARSPAWQKCLVLSQDFAKQYRQIILIDSDIVINVEDAPNIAEQVSPEMVGGVISGSHIHEDLRVVLLSRLRAKPYAYQRGLAHWHADQKEFYLPYGLRGPDTGIVQTGVLVASPERHQSIFEAIYAANYPIETRGYEQLPLSHALLSGELFQQLDTRFNSVFFETMLVHYPYLLNNATPNYELLARFATGVEFANNFFLHFAYKMEFMSYLFQKTR